MLMGDLAQLVRAPALHAGGQGFDSLNLHKESSEMRAFFLGGTLVRASRLQVLLFDRFTKSK